MTTKPKPAAKTPKAPAEPNPCQCFAVWSYNITKGDTPESLQEGDDPNEIVAAVHGTCGETTMHTFAPGHDAKLKGVLLRAARSGQEYAYVDGAMLIYADPTEELRKRMWSHLLVDLKPRAKKERKSTKAAGKAKLAENLAAGPEQPKPGFHPIRVRIGRWMYDGQIVSAKADGRLVVEYQTKKGATETRVVRPDQIVG